MPNIRGDPTFPQYFKSEQVIPVFSLLLTVLNPIPEPLSSSFDAFSSSLGAKLDAIGVNRSHYLLYSAESFHCSIATLHHYSSPTSYHPDTVTKGWERLVDTFIQSSPGLRSQKPYLRVAGAKVFPDGVVVLLYEDHDNVIFAFRKWLADMRTDTQGAYEEGIDPFRVRIPAICHSTVLRWRETPIVGHPGFSTEQLQSLADSAFKETFEPGLMIQAKEVSILREHLPYMQEWTRCKTVTFGSTSEENVSTSN